MPDVIVVEREKEVTGFFGKKYMQSIGYDHILIFPKELNEEELKRWRFFKAGFEAVWYQNL